MLRDGTVLKLNFATALHPDVADRLAYTRHGDLSDARILVSSVSGKGRPTSPVSARRLIIGIGAMALAITWSAIWVGMAVSQSRQVSVEATVASKSCHQADDGDSGTFTACAVTLDYTAPDGTSGEVVFNGVEATRIHDQDGHEWVYIYFSSPSSETAINPQDNVPLFVTVLMVTFSVPVAIGGFVYLRRGFRRPKPKPARVITRPEREQGN
jgi:hypothetical protein